MKAKLSFIGILLCACAFAQPQRSLYDYDYISDTNPWLTSVNASGLGSLAPNRVSFVEATYNKENGGIIPSYGSDNSFQAGVSTESFVRLSDKLAFRGRLAYQYFKGQNMGGQMLMDPTYNPVNFAEADPGRAGTKQRELYDVSGGMSYAIGSRWAIGADFTYQSGYQAKRRDARAYSNYMDLSLSLGAKVDVAEWFRLGFNAQYRRTNEMLSVTTYGTTDIQYYFLVDVGNYFGSSETLGNRSNAVAGSSRPMSNDFLGASLQLDFGKEDGIRFFNELTYLNRSGYYGQKTNSENYIGYHNFSGDVLSYSGSLFINGTDSQHKIAVDAEYETMSGYQNIYLLSRPDGGGTIVNYYGESNVLSSSNVSAGLAYTGYFGVKSYRPKWEVGAEVKLDAYDAVSAQYPFYRESDYHNVNAGVSAKRNFFSGKNIYKVGLDLNAMSGNGTAYKDGEYVASSSIAPTVKNEYLMKDFEFNTLSRVGAGLSIRYTRVFSKALSAYVELSDSCTKLVSAPSHLSGSYRNVALVTIGCSF